MQLRLHLNEPRPYGGDSCCFYPDQAPLRSQIAAVMGVLPHNILMGAGADRILDVIMRSLSPTKVVALQPDFPRYYDHIENAGHDRVVVRFGQYPFVFPEDRLLGALDEQTGAVILATVSNPCGVSLPIDLIGRIRTRAPRALLILDEVYSAFRGLNLAPMAAKDPYMLSLGSLSKVGYPGVRAGWAIGTPASLDRIRPFLSPHEISSESLRKGVRFLSRRHEWPAVIYSQKAALNFLASELESRGIAVARSAANFLLAQFGIPAGLIQTAFEARGVKIHKPAASELEGWLRISTPRILDVKRALEVLDGLISSPFDEIDGALVFKPGQGGPFGISAALPACMLFGTYAEIDHLAIVVPADQFENHLESFAKAGCVPIEGPGLFPRDFCAEMEHFPADLQFRFASLQTPAGGTAVLASPSDPGDQLGRFLDRRGEGAIHHVAIRVSNIHQAAEDWQARGFIPISPLVSDGHMAQQFLANRGGQILEVVVRQNASKQTFTCQNVADLRRSEVQR
jgi:histidinol-phosphate aminotransferase